MYLHRNGFFHDVKLPGVGVTGYEEKRRVKTDTKKFLLSARHDVTGSWLTKSARRGTAGTFQRELQIEVSWWHSGLRIHHCQCCGLGYCYGVGLIPGPGISTCQGHGQNKQTNKQTKKLGTAYPSTFWAGLFSLWKGFGVKCSSLSGQVFLATSVALSGWPLVQFGLGFLPTRQHLH